MVLRQPSKFGPYMPGETFSFGCSGSLEENDKVQFVKVNKGTDKGGAFTYCAQFESLLPALTSEGRP